MHTHDGDTVVDDIHAVARHDVGDRATAAEVDAPKLRELITDAIFVHHAAQLPEVLRTRIARSGLAACAREFVEHHAAPEIGDVLLLERVRIEPVVCARHIRGEHL